MTSFRKLSCRKKGSIALFGLLLLLSGEAFTLSASDLNNRLQEFPMSIQVADQIVRAHVKIWREPGARVIVPGVVLHKPGVTVHVQLMTDGPDPAATGLRVDHVWLYSGRASWEAQISARRSTADRMLGSTTIANGPLWAAGQLVEGLIRLIAKDGSAYLLRSDPAIIEVGQE